MATRLAIMGSHVIPYRTSLYRRLAAVADLEILVIYGDPYGVKPGESGWGVRDFVWDGDHLSGYPHVFLPNVAPRPHPSRFFGRVNPSLPAALARFRPDATLVMGYGGLYQLGALAAAKALGSRVLYTSDTNVLGDPTGAKGLVKRQLVGGLYRLIDTFLVTGTRNREHFEAFGVPRERMYEFPWAVDNDAFIAQAERLAPERETLRAEFGVPRGATCVLAVSALQPWKNIDELIRGVARVPNAYLLVVGSGPDHARLGALASDFLPARHRFAGFMNQSELGRAYVAGDVFAACSRYEPWGLTCNEAMCFGLPIVASDRVGSATDLVVPGETGRVYPLGDIPRLAEALREAAALAANVDALRVKVRARLRSFSTEAQVEGLLRALHRDRTRRSTDLPHFCDA